MINIRKSMSNEPNSLKEFRLRDDVKEELTKNINGMYKKYTDKYNSTELRKALKQEQGNLCCYCMSSIEKSKTKIEHFESRDNNANLEVDYRNLYLACDGEKINCSENQDDMGVYSDCKCKYKRDEDKKKIVKHCDTCKSNRPLIHISLDAVEREIKYDKIDGRIFSDNHDIDSEINNILNLNIKILKNNRLQAKNDLYNNLPQNSSWNQEMITRLIEKYKNQSKKAPYVGFLLYVLKNRLRK